jgi:endoglucanase
MKKIYVSMFMVAAMAAVLWAQQTPNFAAPAGSPVARHGSLRVQGNKIVGQHGRPVTLRGMSFFWNTTGWGGLKYYTPEVVNWLIDDWKADLVRVAIDPAEVNNENWRTVVNAAVSRGVYVIIDFHAHSHQLSGQAESFFTGISPMYRNRPHVIYEIFNEPCANSPQTNGGGGCQGDDWATQVRPYAQRVVNAIRGASGTVDTNIIIIGTPNFSKRVDIASENPVSGRNLAYAVHFYTGHVPTPTDPSGTNSEHRQRLRNWVNMALNNGVAVFASEWGISQPGGGAVTGENNTIDIAEAERWLEFMDQSHISWAMWSVNDKDEAASALRSGASASGNWATGSANCNAANGTTPFNQCNLHGNLACSGNFIRNKLRHYATPVTLTVTPRGPGTVAVSPQSAQYFPTDQVTLTATPLSATDRFEGWQSGVSGNLTANPVTITLSGNTTVEAVFFQNNLISNSTFTTGTTGWASNPAGLTLERVDGEMRVTMPASPGTDPTALRVQHGNTRIDTGMRYRLTFSARAASGTRTITPTVRGGGVAVAWVTGDPVSLTTTMTQFTFEFDQTAASTMAGIVAFNAGGQPGNFFIDNVSLTEIGPVSSIAHVTTAVVRPFRAVFNGRALVLTGGGRVADVTVYDVSGRVRLSKKVSLSNAGTQVSLGRLPAGVYTVRYKVDGKALGTNERIMLAK